MNIVCFLNNFPLLGLKMLPLKLLRPELQCYFSPLPTHLSIKKSCVPHKQCLCHKYLSSIFAQLNLLLKGSFYLDFNERFFSLLLSCLLVGVAVLEGPMYAVGGHDGWSYLNTVERWDPQARQWNFVATMSTPRSTVGVAVLSGK